MEKVGLFAVEGGPLLSPGLEASRFVGPSNILQLSMYIRKSRGSILQSLGAIRITARAPVWINVARDLSLIDSSEAACL